MKPASNRCVACDAKLIANEHGVNDHHCDLKQVSDKQKRRRKRRRERDDYSQRLGDGFLIQGMGGD